MLTASERHESITGNKTILIVEDNVLNMKLARTLLQVGNYQVLCAGNAEAGIHMATEHIPDLILMDIQLPDMDGLTATRKIKSNPRTREIPVVALTAYAMEKDKKMAEDAGCVDHIAKPINTKSFLPTISRYFTDEKNDFCLPASVGEPSVLVVDDEPMNVKLLSTMLEREGFYIATAFNGLKALEKVSANPPDMILLDVMMPGINGFEVTRRLKNDPKTRNIPIILVTALNSEIDKDRGMAAGADEFLNKPVNRTELVARVRSLLKLNRYREQLNSRIRSEEEVIKTADNTKFGKGKGSFGNILIVEDCRKDVDLFQIYLENQPYRLTIAETGEEAISICRKEDVDLILLDLMLPGLDGFDVCKRLRENEKTRNIQIVIASSTNDLDTRLKGIDLGADEFLIKPINKEELVTRIRSLIKKKRYVDRLVNRLETALSVSITDELTELYNCSYLKHFMALERKRCDRQHQPMAFIMIDIDNFKQYNDTYGHLAGDVLLKHFGRLIKKSFRDIDLAARYGGEEFGVVLPYTNKEEAFTVAERFLDSLRNCPLSEGGLQLFERRTASMGIACYPDNGATVAEVIQNADKALYRAKKQGKNQICVC